MSRGVKGLLDYISLLLTSKDPKAMEKIKDTSSPSNNRRKGRKGERGWRVLGIQDLREMKSGPKVTV